jgi:hypothetical protein
MAGTQERRSRDEWSGWVARWKASSLSGTKFAERHGLSEGSLYRWARVLEAEGRVAEVVGFKEVRVREPSSPPKTGVIEIVARTGRVVRVVGEVDVEQFRAVLEVVDPC